MLVRAALISVGLVAGSCTPLGDPRIGSSGFRDNFDRADLGTQWNNTGANWRIVGGQLTVNGARNRPLWLRRRLPDNVRIEFDVRSDSVEGDIKIELFGDGISRAVAESYTATSYVVIFGGWGNQINVLARMNEHGDDRVEDRTQHVEVGRTYHFRIERSGSRVSAFVDDRPLVTMNDPEPLGGPGHDHFAFNNWQSQLTFDNLRISPL